MQDILTSSAISVMGPNIHIFNEASSWSESKQTDFAMLFAILTYIRKIPNCTSWIISFIKRKPNLMDEWADRHEVDRFAKRTLSYAMFAIK